MKDTLLLIVFFLLSGFFASGTIISLGVATTGWSQTYGGTKDDFASSVVQTSDGGYALAGSTLSYGMGGRNFGDFWLVKTDASGSIQWNKTYGGTKDDYASSVVQTSDGGYTLAGSAQLYGNYSEDAWLVKTDSSGSMQWNKTYGGTKYDIALSLVQTSDGGYAIIGRTQSYGVGGLDFWLVKTDEEGFIPEFPLFFAVSAFVALTMVVVIIAKKKLPKRIHYLAT
jgi:hypothetical protein